MFMVFFFNPEGYRRHGIFLEGKPKEEESDTAHEVFTSQVWSQLHLALLKRIFHQQFPSWSAVYRRRWPALDRKVMRHYYYYYLASEY